MKHAPLPLPQIDDYTVMLLVRLGITNTMKRRKARAHLQKLRDTLRMCCGRELPPNVQRLHPFTPDMQAKQEAARRAVAAVEAELAALERAS